jgi:tetratricopeptide (TPR) repeat protein
MEPILDPIPLPARHLVDAAVGWLMLGQPGEAVSELGRVPLEIRNRLDVLQLHWEALSAQKDWDAAYRIASDQVARFPGTVSGWIHRAYAARRRTGGGIAQAEELLLPAVTRFADEPMIRYNLACYSAQQDRLEEAWHWFCKALAVGDALELRGLALADEDLRPIWPRIAVGS